MNTQIKIIEKLLKEVQATYYSIDNILNQEIDYFDNMPENLQESERVQKAEEAIDYLQEAKDSAENIIDCLQGTINYL